MQILKLFLAALMDTIQVIFIALYLHLKLINTVYELEDCLIIYLLWLFCAIFLEAANDIVV